MKPIIGVVERSSAQWSRLGEGEVAPARARWREVFARGVFEATGEWKHLGFDWHAFSYTHTPALEGEAALVEYRKVRAGVLLVLPDGPTAPDDGVRASFEAPPEFARRDALVFPPSYAWTMAFTHEAGWLGPYFARVASRPRPRANR
jgi:hypothetical protein